MKIHKARQSWTHCHWKGDSTPPFSVLSLLARLVTASLSPPSSSGEVLCSPLFASTNWQKYPAPPLLLLPQARGVRHSPKCQRQHKGNGAVPEEIKAGTPVIWEMGSAPTGTLHLPLSFPTFPAEVLVLLLTEARHIANQRLKT